jgi:hypothetical protein
MVSVLLRLTFPKASVAKTVVFRICDEDLAACRIDGDSTRLVETRGRHRRDITSSREIRLPQREIRGREVCKGLAVGATGESKHTDGTQSQE